MATKEIKIPKLSLLKEEDGLLVDLYEFLVVLESLYYRGQCMNTNSSALSMIQELKYVENTPTSRLKEFEDVLQYMVSLQHGGRNSARYSKARIFSSKFLSKWRNYKFDMKIQMSCYTHAIRKLRESQITYWRSRVEVKKYSRMVELTQISRDTQINTDAQTEEWDFLIGGLKEDLAQKLSDHCINAGKYYQALEKEKETRQILVELSNALEEDITNRIKVKIQTALNIYRYEHSSYYPDVDAISNCIYLLLTRTYKLTKPPSDVTNPAFNKIIPYPDEQKPLFDPENRRKISAIHSSMYAEAVPEPNPDKNDGNAREIAEESSEYYLKQQLSDKQNNIANIEDKQNPTYKDDPGVRVKKKGLFASIKRKFARKKKGYTSID